MILTNKVNYLFYRTTVMLSDVDFFVTSEVGHDPNFFPFDDVRNYVIYF